jgi:mono/diheme cytochrome c family protein
MKMSVLLVGMTFASMVVVSLILFSSIVITPAQAAEPGKDPVSVSVVHAATDADSMRVQGEQRYRANCGRCHAAPRKFPPRMMATVLRHMRVRATITQDDMRLVLFYMTQ